MEVSGNSSDKIALTRQICDLPSLKYARPHFETVSSQNPRQMKDSDEYLARRNFFASMLTIYGRNPVMEVLRDPAITPYRLHLADSNRTSNAVQEMKELARERGAEVLMHTRDALSRISKNRRQDQGVVLDIQAPNYQHVDALDPAAQPQLVALENVTNPQNIGMTIRSIGASPLAGIILPKQGSAALDALVIKASAGTLFKTPIYYCDSLLEALPALQAKGYPLYGLAGEAERNLADIPVLEPGIFVCGNETHGLSPEMEAMCDLVKIPMQHGVESLNVSVTAALVAFRSVI